MSFFNYPAPTGLYPLSLHDALPISLSLESTLAGLDASRYRPLSLRRTWRLIRENGDRVADGPCSRKRRPTGGPVRCRRDASRRSEEHTSELQSQFHLVCRPLLEKKK